MVIQRKSATFLFFSFNGWTTSSRQAVNDLSRKVIFLPISEEKTSRFVINQLEKKWEKEKTKCNENEKKAKTVEKRTEDAFYWEYHSSNFNQWFVFAFSHSSAIASRVPSDVIDVIWATEKLCSLWLCVDYGNKYFGDVPQHASPWLPKWAVGHQI